MVRLLPVLVGFGAVLSLIGAATIQYYASKYDHIDVDTILNNRRMVNYYTACLLSKGPCPPEGLEFKRILPDALRTNCVRCTDKQKTVTLRTFKRLQKEYPKIWSQLKEQWDPDDIYVSKFEATFSGKQHPESLPEASVLISNRFADTDSQNATVENVISQIFTTPLSLFSTSTSATTPTTTSKTTARTTTPKTVSTTSRTTTSTTTSRTTTRKISAINTTNKPNINTISASIKPTKRPRPNIGASIQATVSLGTNIVGGFVRGLEAIGNRVVETGAEIAGVVLKSIARPL